MKPTIKFEALADSGAPLSRELVCSIWPLDRHGDESASTEPIVDRHPILVGSPNPQAEESEISLPAPGNYLVDVGFPNGRRSRRAVQVKEDEPYRFVVHESRYSSVSTGGKASSLSLREVPRVVMSAARSLITHSELEVRQSATPYAPGLGSLRTLRSFAKDLEADGDGAILISRERVAELSHMIILDSTPANADTDFQSTAHRRSWLLISGQGQDTTIVPFPNGWTSGTGKGAFVLSVRRNSTVGDEATKWSVSLQLSDPSYGSLLDYLTRRDFQAGAAISRSMRSTALAALYEKMMNPYAAAAGAYLLAIGEEDIHNEQSDWMENLTERFPWLPDGPIAQGYRLLRRTEKGTSEFDQARRLLFKAVDRGLPYFTIGLTLLNEALNFLVLATPEDVEAKTNLAAAMSANLASVRSEAFCTLQTSRYYRLPQGPDERG